MASSLNLSLVQFNITWEAPEVNLDKIERMISNASSEDDVIILPEMFASGFSMKPSKIAATANGAEIRWMQQVAREKNALILGSLALCEEGEYFNRLLAVYPEGKILHYDKRHLFRMAGEPKAYKPGNKRVIINYKGWRVALFICYDLRFPVWSSNRDEYDLAVYVANWPASRSEVWKTLLKARAIENQCYVAGVNRVGADGKETYDGNSLVSDFQGNIMTGSNSCKEEVINVTVDLNPLKEFKNNFPAWLDADNFEIVL